MEWDLRESEYAASVIRDIARFDGPRRSTLSAPFLHLRYADAVPLREGLASDHTPLLLVRHVLRAMEFDENRVFRWHIEHKLVQSLIIQHFCPGAMPSTRGLSTFLNCAGNREEAMRCLASPEVVVKAALGEGSGELGTDYVAEAIAALCSGEGVSKIDSPVAESYIVQQRLPIRHEYRVHSIEDKVVSDLTFYRYSGDPVPITESSPVEAFVQKVIDHLPAGLVNGTMYGWDVAVTEDGVQHAIEANPTGYHPVFRRGFQCSGFFQTDYSAAQAVARLLLFISKHYCVSVRIETSSAGDDEGGYYWWVNKCLRLLKVVKRVRPHIDGQNAPPKRSMDIRLSGAQNAFQWALSELEEICGKTERSPVLTESAEAESAETANMCEPVQNVVEMFERSAATWPDAEALTARGESLTYTQLNAAANQLARYLLSRGIGRGNTVVILLERDRWLVTAFLGVLKTGAAYLPLDPEYPQSRLEYMLRAVQPALILTETGLHVPAVPVHSVCVDGEWTQISKGCDGNLHLAIDLDDVAYVIFTSGSTGLPKGIEIPHRGLANILADMRDRLAVRPEDRWLSVTTISFDIAALEVFLPLANGSHLFLASRETALDPRQLRATFEAVQPTLMQATPITWQTLLEAGWAGSPHLRLLCGGEALHPTLAKELCRRALRAFNVYGPTETTIWSTALELKVSSDIVSVGFPIANTTIRILDDHLREVQPGEIGEICIGGAGLAKGYLKDPELTAARFVADPRHGRPGSRLYRTGDLGRCTEDGTTEFLGRKDQQIKIRGFRVELGEIEFVIKQHPDVLDSVVIAGEDTSRRKCLIAYVVPRRGRSIEPATLRTFVAGRLPTYMVPHSFPPLPAFPLTTNGKVDRKALPARCDLSADGMRTARQAAFESEFEKAVAKIWCGVFGVTSIDDEATFLELGGDSFAATRCLLTIERQLAVRLPYATLFSERATVRHVAGLVERLGGKPGGPGAAAASEA